MRRATVATLVCATLLAGTFASPALAEDPAVALKNAFERTAAARTARIVLRQTATSGGRTLETVASGTLAGPDSDVVVSGERGRTRRVAVGTTVHARELDQPGAEWRRSERPVPQQPTPFGALRLKDGTSAGDPKLYKRISETASAPSVATTAGRTLVGELDMAALATAMVLGPADRLRLERMQATLTVQLADDGRVLRHALAITIPGPSGPTTLETGVELSDLDAALTVTPP